MALDALTAAATAGRRDFHAFRQRAGPARIRDEPGALQPAAGSPCLGLRSHPDDDAACIAASTHAPHVMHVADPLAHGRRSLEPGEPCEGTMPMSIDGVGV